MSDIIKLEPLYTASRQTLRAIETSAKSSPVRMDPITYYAVIHIKQEVPLSPLSNIKIEVLRGIFRADEITQYLDTGKISIP